MSRVRLPMLLLVLIGLLIYAWVSDRPSPAEPQGSFRVENVNGIISTASGLPVLAVIRVVNSEANGGFFHFKYLPLQLVSSSNGTDLYVFNADIGLYALPGARIEFIANVTGGFPSGEMVANVTISGREQLQ